MNKKKLTEFKVAFEAEKLKLETVLSTKSQSELDVDGDETDKIQGTQLSNLLTKLSERDLLKLNKINHALEKIEDGTFGECEECGEDIGEKRLYAKPDVVTCVFCQEKLEKLSKSFK
jgi:DnaK suppressor protein